MLLLVTVLLIIVLISRITEESIKIPSTLSIIIYAFVLSYFFPHLFNITHNEFDEILYLMLPVILLPDVLNLSIKELKENAKEIFYLAFIAVVASIGIAILVTPYILPEYQWSFGVLIALFSMLMATDAITVASIMSKFKLPEYLKVYAESESLFNDVTALIIFYFVAIPLLNGGEVSAMSLNITLFKVLFLSIVIGIGVATLGYLSIKILKNPLDQFIILYLVVIVSFLLAEHFHIAGILSIVASVLTFKSFIQKEIRDNLTTQNFNDIQNSILQLIKKVPTITKKEFREYKKEAMFIGIFANAIVFIIISNIIIFEDLIIYAVEIFTIFALTTLIRFGAIFSMIKTLHLPVRWAQTLTLAGSKGALTIIMSHSLPLEFIYREMFIAIVIGNVLLSTFIYTGFLILHIYLNKKNYAQDIVTYDNITTKQMEQNDYVKSLVTVLEKDEETNAYNKPFIEDILEKEISRAQRYKVDFSILTFKVLANEEDIKQLKEIAKVINSKIRLNDNFGKLDSEKYLILTANTSLSGAIVLAEKITHKIKKLHNIQLYFGVTQMSDTDTLESIYEKLEDALQRALLENGQKIEVEV
ncbi:MAG: cation:proton antiporter [Campylobacterota bacterium]|nr:cation:proton antiporter [Campylobacterota bacterium]